MTFDGLTLAAQAAELRQTILHARVQKIVQPDPHTLALQLYGNRERTWLLLSGDPQRPRVHLTSERPGRGVDTPTPILLLLRKHIDGLRLGTIEQPAGERILNLGFVGPSADGEAPILFRLIIEAISQYSNVILVDAAGQILEAIKRVTAEQNRSRVTLPRHPYQPPPAQHKHALTDLRPAGCQEILASAGAGAAIWQALVAGFAGVGPLAGREVSFRATGEARARVPADVTAHGPLAERLALALQEIVAPVLDGSFEATVARSEGGEITAFAPYPLTHLGRWEARASLSAAADEFYRQVKGVGAIEIARRTLHSAIAAERSQASRKRESLLRALEGTAKAEELRERGEMLLAYAASIPRGAANFSADGVSLELDPRLSAVDNAQACFRRYKKLKGALREVPTLLDEVNLRLNYLDEVAAWADLAETADAVRALRSELRPVRARPDRPTKRRKARRPEDGVTRARLADGAEVLIGHSALQNHAVTFELSKPDDIWLHARGCTGAHVILRSEATQPAEPALHQAAVLAAQYSANRTNAKVAVDWTRRKYVRRLGKGAPGLVSYSNEQTLTVRPDESVAD